MSRTPSVTISEPAPGQAISSTTLEAAIARTSSSVVTPLPTNASFEASGLPSQIQTSVIDTGDSFVSSVSFSGSPILNASRAPPLVPPANVPATDFEGEDNVLNLDPP
ncbi:hypothetical protein P7C70_g5999, partial [Phenoliferia sp. Uapishka_3]